MSKIASLGIELCLSWREIRNGDPLPDGAVCAGESSYVCRVQHEGQWVPGNYSLANGIAYVPYGCAEHQYNHCEVLVDTSCGIVEGAPHYAWIPATDGTVPNNALVAGADEGRPLYVARCVYEGDWCSGKVLREHACAYMPHDGKECLAWEYEVLVMVKRNASQQCAS